MANFGQYVHLHWQNYKIGGTYRSQVNWRGREKYDQQTNYSRVIFKNHRQNILKAAKKFDIPNLKELEDRYNASNSNMAKWLNDLVIDAKTNKGRAKSLLKDILQMINKSWNDVQLEEILNHLAPSDNGLIKYTGQGFLKEATNNIKGFQPTGQNMNAASLLNRCEKLREEIRNFSDEELSDKQKYYTTLNRIEYAIKAIIENGTVTAKALKNVENIPLSKEQLSTIHGRLKVPEIVKNNKSIEQKYIIDPLNEIYALFTTRKIINAQLAYRIPEILGELIAENANEISYKTLKELFKELKTTGGTGQKTTDITVQPEIFSYFNKEALSGNAKEPIYSDENGEKVIIDYQLRPVGGKVQQKTDIIFEGQNISMKTTSLENIEYQSQYTDIPSISLQSSSLFLYLLGIQQQEEDLGTHYLNILASHPDEDQLYTAMRKEANRALQLYIFYSALTGEGQLREGKFANIFAVYEKNNRKNQPPKVRFFSTYKMIEKMDQLQDGAIFDPPISTLHYANEFVGEGNKKDGKNANLRISRLLVDVRNEQISAYVAKSFLTKNFK